MCFVNEAAFAAATLLIISEIFKLRSDVKLSAFDMFTPEYDQ
jgi:hypothetical protein